MESHVVTTSELRPPQNKGHFQAVHVPNIYFQCLSSLRKKSTPPLRPVYESLARGLKKVLGSTVRYQVITSILQLNVLKSE